VKARAAALAALCVAACGGGGSAPSPKTVEPERSGGELDGASEEFAPETPTNGQQPGYGQQAAPTGPFAEEPPLTLEEASDAFDSAATELSSVGNDCVRGCKALASMQRSSERICELNGPSDPGSRCQKARDRLQAAREVLTKRCGSCDS
jgi:hypothetical protein